MKYNIMDARNWHAVPDDDIPKPSKEWLVTEIAEIEKEIAWNERRVANLVFNEEDWQQTIDLAEELREERKRLLAVLNG